MQAVWSSVLDGTWDVCVSREGEYNGLLTITRVGETEPVFTQAVGLSYTAIFGPDMSDVAAWQEIAIQYIESRR